MLEESKAVLVTGATGFIGEHVCRHLLGAGYRVRALLRQQYSSIIYGHSSFEHCNGDLSDPDSLFRACEDIEVIIHIAGVAHADNTNDESLRRVNVGGTERLLSAALDQKVKRFILMSSSLAGVCDEEGNATTGYGQSKIDAEQLLLSAISSGSIEGVILRPVNVYGPGMRGNIASLISRISRGRMPPLPRLGTLVSLIGVDDLCRAIAISIESTHATGKTYILTDGEQYNVSDIESEIYRALGKEVPRWKTPRVLLYLAVAGVGLLNKILSLVGIRLPELRSVSTRTYRNLVTENLFDNSETCRELNFKPTSTFYSSLPGIVADFKSL